jgi:hypothetical protein
MMVVFDVMRSHIRRPRNGASVAMNSLRGVVFLLGLLTAPGIAWSQITLVQVRVCGQQAFPSTCTISSTGSGNLIVIGFQMAGGVNTATTVSSVSDNAGNTYSEVPAARAIDTGAKTVIDLWYAQNSASGATSVTITPSASVNAGAVIWEFSGVDRTAPLDQSAVLNSQAATITVSGAPLTVTSTPEKVIISIAEVADNVTGIVAGNTFVNDSTLMGNGWAHLITSAAGTYKAQWTQSPAGTFDSSTVSFNAAVNAAVPGTSSFSACDVNKDGLVNVVDVQIAIDNALSCPATAFQTFYSQVLNGVLTSCSVTSGLHTVTLNWAASATSGVTYNVYRATTSGGYSTPLNSTQISGTSFSDCSAASGQTYYYVVRAVDSNGNQSANSSETAATIPSS